MGKINILGTSPTWRYYPCMKSWDMVGSSSWRWLFFSDLPSYSCFFLTPHWLFPYAPLLMSSGDLENESIPLFHTKFQMPKNRRRRNNSKDWKKWLNIYAQKNQVMPPRPDVAASSMPAAVLKFHRSRSFHSHQLELEEFDPILRSKPTDFCWV